MRTICVWMVSDSMRPDSSLIRVCQTMVRLPRWSGVASARTVPERPTHGPHPQAGQQRPHADHPPLGQGGAPSSTRWTSSWTTSTISSRRTPRTCHAFPLVKEEWGKLTDDDLKATEGKFDKLSGVIRERYGYSREKAEEELERFYKEHIYVDEGVKR